MKQIKIVTCVFLFSFLNILAIAQSEMIKFGDIHKEHLRMTTYEADTSASAVVLAEVGKVNFNFTGNRGTRIEFTKHRRIKILKRSGFDYGDISIPYYAEDGYESISKLKATIYNPDGSEQKLKKKDFFVEKLNDNWEAIKFTFPDLQEGSIIEYTYLKLTERMFELPEWYFQHAIPTIWSEYSVSIPNFYDYVALQQGTFDTFDRSFTQKRFSYRGDGGVSRSDAGYITTEVLNVKYIKNNVPALKEERYITTMDDYRTRIRFQLSAVEEGGIKKPIMTTWAATAQNLEEASYFGDQYLKKGKCKDIVDEVMPLVSGVTDPMEKVQIVYNFINDKMEWDGIYTRYASDDIEKCFEKGTGSTGEMNLMLVAALKALNIEAYPAMISTRSNGNMTSTYPILDQFDHTMAYVIVNDKGFFVDAGNSMRPLGMIRASALNGEAWIVSSEKSKWVQLKPQSSSVLYMAKLSLDDEGTLSGSIDQMCKGYSAVSTRAALISNYEEKVKEEYTEVFPDASFSNISVQNLEDTKKSLKYSTEVSIPEAAMANGDFIYISPILIKMFEENPFKSKERQFPVDMNYPFGQRFILNLSIPEGYSVEELPESMRISLPDNGGMFHFDVKQTGELIVINSNISFKKDKFKPEGYGALKHFVDLIIEKQSEQIVLKLD